MNVIVVINRLHELQPRQTTTLLVSALVNAGHQVFLTDLDAFADGVSCNIAELQIESIALHQDVTQRRHACHPARVVSATRQSNRRTHRVAIADLLLIRTNPGRDLARQDGHAKFLHLAAAIAASGVRVVNSPLDLTRMADKASLLELSARYIPESLVSADAIAIERFIRAVNRTCVIKPLVGSRGRNVIRISPSEPQLRASIQQAVRTGATIVQEFVESESPGDTRVVCVGGQVLELNGHAAAIRRIPAAGDFRANLHVGGEAQPARLTPTMAAAANHAAQFLNDHGIWLAGIDLVVDKIIEMNVFSTGGLYDAQRFTGQDFCAEIVARLVISH